MGDVSPLVTAEAVGSTRALEPVLDRSHDPGALGCVGGWCAGSRELRLLAGGGRGVTPGGDPHNSGLGSSLQHGLGLQSQRTTIPTALLGIPPTKG